MCPKQIDVPKLILDDNEDYNWQARHYDNHSTPSPWSANRSFTTEVDPSDTNSNGIPDEQEVTTPSDLDGDGTWDSDQNTIKCVVTGENQSLGISKTAPTLMPARPARRVRRIISRLD
jgi:hypothetical protein